MRNLFLAATALTLGALAQPAHAGSRWLDRMLSPYGGEFCQFFDPASGEWITYPVPGGRCMSYAAPGYQVIGTRPSYGYRSWRGHRRGRYGLRIRG